MKSSKQLGKPNSCRDCIYLKVCHLYEVISNNNELKRPPYTIRFLFTVANIGAVCQQHEVTP